MQRANDHSFTGQVCASPQSMSVRLLQKGGYYLCASGSHCCQDAGSAQAKMLSSGSVTEMSTSRASGPGRGGHGASLKVAVPVIHKVPCWPVPDEETQSVESCSVWILWPSQVPVYLPRTKRSLHRRRGRWFNQKSSLEITDSCTVSINMPLFKHINGGLNCKNVSNKECICGMMT